MKLRKFETGAIRDADDRKLDFEGSLAPIVLERYVEYIQAHQTLSDGSKRANDNWQKGMPIESFKKSLTRHFMQAWGTWREFEMRDDKGDLIDLEDALCAIIFNTQGFLFELIKERKRKK